MDTNIISILVNHTSETFHIMEDQAETLDIILFNTYGEITDQFGDFFAQYIKWNNNQEITLESYRSNGFDYRAEVNKRLNDLRSCGYVEV